jgi:hypothetical protein
MLPSRIKPFNFIAILLTFPVPWRPGYPAVANARCTALTVTDDSGAQNNPSIREFPGLGWLHGPAVPSMAPLVE